MIRIFKIIAWSILFTCGVVNAQSNAEILKQIKSKSGELKEFRDLLNSPDASIRLSAFESMSKSDNQALRQLALDEGINSQDAVLRGMAFQELMMSLKTLSMTVKTDGLAPEARKLVLAEMGELYTLSFRKFVRVGATLNFETEDSMANHYENANINGLKMNWITRACTGEATLQTGGLLTGVVRCPRALKGMTVQVSGALR